MTASEVAREIGYLASGMGSDPDLVVALGQSRFFPEVERVSVRKDFDDRRCIALECSTVPDKDIPNSVSRVDWEYAFKKVLDEEAMEMSICKILGLDYNRASPSPLVLEIIKFLGSDLFIGSVDNALE